MSKVVLVNPPVMVSRWAYSGTLTPPVGLAYVAAVCRKAGHDVAIIDSVGEKPTQNYPFFKGSKLEYLVHGLTVDEIVSRIHRDVDVIGLTCMFSAHWPLFRDIIRAIKEEFRQVPIILGGEHASAVPEHILYSTKEVDFCVLGEGEETFVRLIDAIHSGGHVLGIEGIAYLQHGSIFRTKHRARIRNIDDIPWPAWDLFPIANYMEHGLNLGVNCGRSMPILASRGCPYRCTFCSSPQMWTTRWVVRDPDSLLDEIQSYIDQYQATNFDFYDLTAIIKREWILSFAAKILHRGMGFTWQMPTGTRSEAIDGEVASRLKKSGCVNVTYAPESGSKELLQRIKKRVNLSSIKISMKEAAEAGLIVRAQFIFGLPDETPRDLWKTIRLIVWAAFHGVADITIGPFTPYPGSELFESFKAKGRIPELTDDFFLSLSAQNKIGTIISWSENFSHRKLSMYCFLGQGLFYSIAFLLNPFRIFRMIWDFSQGKETTVLDKAIRGFLRRQLRLIAAHWERKR